MFNVFSVKKIKNANMVLFTGVTGPGFRAKKLKDTAILNYQTMENRMDDFGSSEFDIFLKLLFFTH